jgi:hypothetical protein
MAAKDTSVALIASRQTESERQSPVRSEPLRGELVGSDPILKMFGARWSLNHSCQKLTPVNSWDCIPKPFNASPARENFRLFAWGVIGVFVPVS